MVAGLPLTPEPINRELARRQRGFGRGGRMSIEKDEVEILAGVMAGHTTGAPLALLVRNRDAPNWQGRSIPPFVVPRPGHADLSGALKYRYRDLRLSLERASARETTARVAIGAICKRFLETFGIFVGGYVRQIGTVQADLPLATDPQIYRQRFEQAEQNDVRCPDPEAAQAMRLHIQEAIRARDTLGGVIEVFALGLPAGLGSYVQWDRRLDGRLLGALASIPAVKGAEIGDAFHQAGERGTRVHDAILRDEQGNLYRPSNRAGGLEGGVTNGMPLVVRAAMKPIATTLTPQRSVNLVSGEMTETVYERSDICPVPRAVVVAEAMVAFILADALLEKLGGDSLEELRPRFEALPRPRLPDLPLDGQEHVFW
uniref:Chorismate synthase n=1 Tax=uncultured Chloroflexota bacterium TaxID=166587 RepID=H5SDW7_9CHLR|nr:chorismate synthase [uncultured Chloroflexota bacterium]